MKKLLNLKILLLVIILALAAFLRLYRIGDYMTFLGDEGRDVLVVYNILHGHFTLLGPTSSVGGFFLGPIYYYFMAPFLFLFQYNPVGPAIMVALFGIVSVWIIYKIGSEFFNATVGLLAAFFYSIAPVVIAYSRSSWNPNLMPFFTITTLYSLYLGVLKNKKKYFFLVGILLGIIMQLHYLGIFVAVIIGIYVPMAIIFIKKYKQIKDNIVHVLRNYLLISFGFIIGFSPFLIFEVRHGFPNIRSIIKFIFFSPDVHINGNFFGIIWNVFFRLFGRLITAFPPPEQISLNAHLNIFVWYWLTVILAICSVGYFIWQTYLIMPLQMADKQSQNFRNNAREVKILQYVLLILWFFVGVLLFGFYRKQIYDYYFEFIFPLPFLFSAVLFYGLLRRNLTLKLFACISIFAIAFVNLKGAPFLFPPNRQYHQAKTIAQFVLNKTNGKPYNFALITGSNSDFAYRYFFTIWGDPPVSIINSNFDPHRASVTSQLLVICETLPCAPLGNSLWEIAGFGRAEIAGRWNISVVQVYKLVHYKNTR